MRHKIALIGFGTVGQGVSEILLDRKEFLQKKYGFEYDIVAVADLIYGNVYDPGGLDLEKLLAQAGQKKFTAHLTDWDNLTLIRQSNATIICEMTYTDLKTGGAAVDHCRAAFGAKKHLVASNKGPAALMYTEMKRLAQKNGVQFLIEGTVCSGTPVLNLAAGPLAGCEITAVRGIVNGTTNFMLSEMEKGMDYAAALVKAQQLGYAEADPSGDVEGYDARAKVTILVNAVMGVPLAFTGVSCRGITGITPADIAAARKQGARWKLIASAEKKDGRVMASVAPQLVPLSHPLAGIDGTACALTFQTDLLGEVTITGPGAGRRETGFSILSDLLYIHRFA